MLQGENFRRSFQIQEQKLKYYKGEWTSSKMKKALNVLEDYNRKSTRK